MKFFWYTTLVLSGVLVASHPLFASVSIPLLGPSGDAQILVPEGTSSVINHAISDFNEDCQETTKRKLTIITDPPPAASCLIIPAVVGKSTWLDALEKSGKIDLKPLQGQWESYLIEPVSDPLLGVKTALVVAGSDPRGVMYGLYEVSERVFGTDPQKYWTDAIPKQIDSSNWNFGRVTQASPTFKFRGWFVNDEHGLLGWHHVPGQPNRIEPAVWAKIFETICRMRGNFFTLIEYGEVPDAASLKLANDRGLYITGSHMHMLISNTSYGYDGGPLTSYWDAYCREHYGHTLPYHWMTYSKEIASFWEDEGVKKHKDDLAIWTIGLKNANDTDFAEGDPDAPKTLKGKAQVTNEAVQLEEKIVRRNLPAGADPLFMVAMRNDLFDQYTTGEIHWPANTMVLWPDEPSFGYFRQLPKASDFAASPHHGIFMHLQYCDNHWVQWVPLAQVQQQLVNVVRAGAVSMAEFNVGDIRESPLKISLAMDFTRDAQPWMDDPNHWRTFTENWITREYQPLDTKATADLFVRYWTLEIPVRSMIILERLSQYTILDQSVLKAVAGKPDKKAALVAFAQGMHVPSGDRFGKLGRDYLVQNAPNWNTLWEDAQAAASGVSPERRQFYQDSFLLQVATSRLMNLWGGEIFQGFDAIKESKFTEAAAHFERASRYVAELADERHLSEHGKWQRWFDGDQLYPWTNQMWGFHDKQELAAEQQIIALLRSVDQTQMP